MQTCLSPTEDVPCCLSCPTHHQVTLRRSAHKHDGGSHAVTFLPRIATKQPLWAPCFAIPSPPNFSWPADQVQSSTSPAKRCSWGRSWGKPLAGNLWRANATHGHGEAGRWGGGGVKEFLGPGHLGNQMLTI